MLDGFLFCLTVSLFCTGLFVAMNGKGMVLVPLANFLSVHIPEWLCKPLFECLTCMSSVWTVYAWLYMVKGISFKLLACIVVVAGLNSIIAVILKPMFDE